MICQHNTTQPFVEDVPLEPLHAVWRAFGLGTQTACALYIGILTTSTAAKRESAVIVVATANLFYLFLIIGELVITFLGPWALSISR
jgi:hypothetical protein